MTGWLDTESLDNAMAEEGCGCRKILSSRKNPDVVGSKIEEEVGTMQAKKWNCPLVCGGKPDASKLTEKQLEAYKAIRRLTSLPVIQEDEEGNCDVIFETCPYYYYDIQTQSGKDVKRVFVAKDWKQTGQFSVVEEPLNLIIEAITIMEMGFKQAENHIVKKQRDESEAKMTTLMAGKVAE